MPGKTSRQQRNFEHLHPIYPIFILHLRIYCLDRQMQCHRIIIFVLYRSVKSTENYSEFPAFALHLQPLGGCSRAHKSHLIRMLNQSASIWYHMYTVLYCTAHFLVSISSLCDTRVEMIHQWSVLSDRHPEIELGCTRARMCHTANVTHTHTHRPREL